MWSLEACLASGWVFCVLLDQEGAKRPGAQELGPGASVGFCFGQCCFALCTPRVGYDHPGRPGHCSPLYWSGYPSLFQVHPCRHQNRWAGAGEGQIGGLDRRKGIKEVHKSRVRDLEMNKLIMRLSRYSVICNIARSKYSRVLILPTRGILLYGLWMAMILMMYSVDGLRPEEIHVLYFSQTFTKINI